jgi:hypothetical protein
MVSILLDMTSLWRHHEVMDLKPLTRSVQEQLAAAAAVGDEPTRRAAELLSISLEPALRLALQEAIGQVAAEVSADLAPGRVDLSLRGGELDVHVVPPAPAVGAPPAPGGPPAPGAPPRPGMAPGPGMPPGPGVPPPPSPAGEEDSEADAPASRVTFRPPQPLKARLEQAAASEALSLNTYLVRALTAHLDQPDRTASSAHSAGRTSGWFL